MTYLPLKRDDNGGLMQSVGTDTIGDVRSLDTNWLAIQFATDIKGMTVSVDSGTVYVKGTEPSSVAACGASAVVDNGDGTVTISVPAHEYTDGDTFTLVHLDTNGNVVRDTDYPGEYTILAAGDANTLCFTATYVAASATTTADYAVGYRYPSFTAGQSFEIPTGLPALNTVCSLKAAVTGQVSIFAWR